MYGWRQKQQQQQQQQSRKSTGSLCCDWIFFVYQLPGLLFSIEPKSNVFPPAVIHIHRAPQHLPRKFEVHAFAAWFACGHDVQKAMITWWRTRPRYMCTSATKLSSYNPEKKKKRCRPLVAAGQSGKDRNELPPYRIQGDLRYDLCSESDFIPRQSRDPARQQCPSLTTLLTQTHTYPDAKCERDSVLDGVASRQFYQVTPWPAMRHISQGSLCCPKTSFEAGTGECFWAVVSGIQD